MSDELYSLVAFTGYGNAGKDEAAKPLLAKGYTRRAFGDVIKRRLRDACPCHLKIVLDWMDENEPRDVDARNNVRAGFITVKQGRFDPFTEDDQIKQFLRPVLERYGETFYDAILRDYFQDLPARTVNTRLVRVREGQAWVERGGIILEVQRPGVGPATDWERDRLQELRDAGLIRAAVVNDGDLLALDRRVLDACQER